MRNFAKWAIVNTWVLVLAVGMHSAAFARSAPESFAPLADKLLPSVVNISTTQKIKAGGLFGGDPRVEEQFRDFFERFLPPGAGPQPFGMPQEREAQSLGSGFIIDEDGYIVTNNHVIADSTEIHVILSDNTKLDAEIVGRDPKTDLALLKVESSEKLSAVSFGDSDDARVGDWVMAIGNPFGLGGTVTAGIISARARNINAGPFDDFIQTDASINRGNSGGPLFDMDGKVIGINTAIFSPTGGSIGIGFAVPSTMAETVIKQLKEHGRTFRGWLGVKIQVVSDDIAESLGLDKPKGALVVEVNEDGPSHDAGIEVGDVILKFDGRNVDEMRDLPRMVAETKIGKKTEVVVLRSGKKKNLTVKLGELDEDMPQVVASSSNDNTPSSEKVDSFKASGAELAELTKALRTRFGIEDAVKGLIVLGAERGSEAAKRGLQAGDVIEQVNDTKTESIDAFKKAMKAADRKFALLRVSRGGSIQFITLPTKEE